MALPRGGVPVGAELARELGAELDVIVARKLGAPTQPELGIGAVAPGSVRVLDERLIGALAVPQEYLERITAQETAEIERRLRCFRGDHPPTPIAGRTVILVDDGIATGVTARAAIASLRAQAPSRIVLAAPVCSPEGARILGAAVDETVCLHTPPDFRAVGLWYRNFDQTTDEEVIHLLELARAAAAGGAGDQG